MDIIRPQGERALWHTYLEVLPSALRVQHSYGDDAAHRERSAGDLLHLGLGVG